MTTRYNKPLPTIDPETKAYWDACKRHELRVQRCRKCHKFQFYPRAICGNCLAQDSLEWVRASGKGKVYTFTVTHSNRSPGFSKETPYVLAYIELEEGVKMLSNIIGCEPSEVHIDMPVEVAFEDATPEVTLPKFRPLGRGRT